ncbi:MAG: DUF547 domain-containing protein [Desulfobacterales bacterium]|nr:DUF547 domain-containing protein [Desulfobacterales bacterium]
MIKHAYILILFSLIIVPRASAIAFDHSQFDQILKAYVDDQGLVDYNGIAKDTRFQNYMELLKSARTDEMTIDGRLAFWINAYNAVTIDKVFKWKPKKSVRETVIPGMWTSTKFFTSREHIVAGKQLSQDDIEHEILRKQLQDPRIHFAIVCASSSCPKLARFAFSEEHVQRQLGDETRKYMNSDRGTRIDYAENTLYLSKIFDWFADDFKNKSGSVLAFIKPYLDPDAMAFLERKPKIGYIRYNWALNAKKPLRFKAPIKGP